MNNNTKIFCFILFHYTLWIFTPSQSKFVCSFLLYDDVIKWKHLPRYWPFVRGIHRSPVNSPHEGQWRGALMFSLICVWINGWVNNGGAGDFRRYRAHYDVTVMYWCDFQMMYLQMCIGITNTVSLNTMRKEQAIVFLFFFSIVHLLFNSKDGQVNSHHWPANTLWRNSISPSAHTVMIILVC